MVLCIVAGKFDRPGYFYQYVWSRALRLNFLFRSLCPRICWISNWAPLSWPHWFDWLRHWPSQCWLVQKRSSQHNERKRCLSRVTEAEEIAERRNSNFSHEPAPKNLAPSFDDIDKDLKGFWSTYNMVKM